MTVTEPRRSAFTKAYQTTVTEPVEVPSLKPTISRSLSPVEVPSVKLVAESIERIFIKNGFDRLLDLYLVNSVIINEDNF